MNIFSGPTRRPFVCCGQAKKKNFVRLASPVFWLLGKYRKEDLVKKKQAKEEEEDDQTCREEEERKAKKKKEEKKKDEMKNWSEIQRIGIQWEFKWN